MNDNHDEKGRFASGPGGASDGRKTSAGKSLQKITAQSRLDVRAAKVQAHIAKVGADKAYADLDSGKLGSYRDVHPSSQLKPTAPHAAHPKAGGPDPHPFRKVKDPVGQRLRAEIRASKKFGQ